MRGFTCAAAAAAAAVLLVTSCSGRDADAFASTSGGATEVASPVQTITAGGFPELPPRRPVPIDLSTVPGFDFFDFYEGDHDQQVRSEVLEIWRAWAIGAAVQQCMVGHGYDWALELPGSGSGNVGAVLEHYGREGNWRDVWPLSMPVYQYAPNDAMLTGLGDAGARKALGVLYGDLSAFHDYILRSPSTPRDDAEETARLSVELFLEMPRYTSETGDGGILEYAGGCIGEARESLPDFVAIPKDMSDAYYATADVAKDTPLLIEARSAFDQCIDGLGITMDVDPDAMEVIEELDWDLVEAAGEECQNPYLAVLRRLQELARDQFARDYAAFLTARNTSYDELYASLDTDPGFLAFVDLLESQAANAT